MTMLQILSDKYGKTDCRDLGSRQLEMLRDGLKEVSSNEIQSARDGMVFIELLRKFREAVAENDKLHGENYPQLLNSLLSVGEDGLYSNSLRFIFELIQNVDDCEFETLDDCKLDIHFDFNNGEIVLTYNEVGFTPFNVFAITGIAEAAKNVSASKNEIGEKGIGFKSVFGVAKQVLIRSGWFSFELYKDNFTIPVAAYKNNDYCAGTQMTLYVPGKTRDIYRQIRDHYCRKEALFSKNPLLFLNKLTSLKLYYDGWRSMEFNVSRTVIPKTNSIFREDDVRIAVNLKDYENGREKETIEEITCTRYTYSVLYSQKACQSRYGDNTLVGSKGGKPMLLQAVIPHIEDVEKVGKGGLYSFLPTQLRFTVPIVCHAPFKLDASREFVDPQDKDIEGGNLWFKDTARYLSELMDHVLSDWAQIVKQRILYYLPYQNSSLFAVNNGKEECLSGLSTFEGAHYLSLPLFETVEGHFKKADSIFCFESSETIKEQIKVAELIGADKSLFICPENVNVGRYGISVEKNVYNRLFRRSFSMPKLTSAIIEYLDSVGYEYSEKQLPMGETFKLSYKQIECIMKNNKLSDIMQHIAIEAIKGNRRPRINISDAKITDISMVLSEQFELSETPRTVEKYMQYCKGACICIDISEDKFLPCHNGVLLSANNPLSSFAAFCYKMDSRDTFAIRIKLREASSTLNKCVESDSGTAADYLRALRNVRLTIKDSLGATGYKSYLDLILKSGSDRTRFIQELIQNADDCKYPEDKIPTFKLTQNEGRIETEYNEIGFTRANIRSITAIGESTKNRLLNGDLRSIGEKGVGFKTVFATASEVKIFSGDYNFSLRADEPTIPKLLNTPKDPVKGTRMEITLKDRSQELALKTADILELCLCLRQLKALDINGHTVSIVDSDDQRTITIDRRSYVFSKYIYSFIVNDKNAIREKENGTREVSPNQQITCYVPEKLSATDFPLYTGLPTKHRVRIPMVIDAPFELTTSREEIEVGCAAWNDIVRAEMYNAIVSVMHKRKSNDRANVLRFSRFRFQISGNLRMYVNDLSDLQYLNNYDYLSRLRSEKVLPTFDTDTFVSVSERTAFKYPEAVTILLGKLAGEAFDLIRPSMVIDTQLESTSKEQRERIDAIFNALSCDTAPFSKVLPLLKKYAEAYVGDELFRTNLYEYLKDTEEVFHSSLKCLKIIPVYSRTSGIEFISWEEDGIFVKKDAKVSGKTYWILNENILPKAICEKMLGVNINEMNAEWEKNRYRSALEAIIRESSLDKIYSYLIAEYASGNLQKNDCLGILLQLQEEIPLKNELGLIVDDELFLCNQPSGYFAVDMLQRITVNKECEGLAEFIKCRMLSDIHYDEIGYFEDLNADDIEALEDTYFIHSEEILRGFYRDGYLSDELLREYDLEFLDIGKPNTDIYYDFPEQRVINSAQLKSHIGKLFKNPVKIVTVRVERSIQKGQKDDGVTFDLGINDARDGALLTYAPEGQQKLCFCQICKSVKPHRLIEVNNIELRPRYYFPQLRIALCLECSKTFELLRNNQSKREAFLEAIMNADTSLYGSVDVPISKEITVTFTAKHLAEIQEILKRMPE